MHEFVEILSFCEQLFGFFLFVEGIVFERDMSPHAGGIFHFGELPCIEFFLKGAICIALEFPFEREVEYVIAVHIILLYKQYDFLYILLNSEKTVLSAAVIYGFRQFLVVSQELPDCCSIFSVEAQFGFIVNDEGAVGIQQVAYG